MPVETATYISDLNASYPAAGDARSEGDDHIRLVKATVKATFPNINSAVTVTDEQLNSVTSRGPVLISSATASASSAVDFTSGIDSTYEEYEIHLINVISSNATAISLRTSANAGSSWDSSSGDYDWTRVSARTTSTSVANGSTTATDIPLNGANTVDFTTAMGGYSGVIRIFNPAGTASHKRINWQLSTATSGTRGNIEVVTGSGSRFSTAAINGVRFYVASSTIASGKFLLYGVVK
jgi:hypothetical protein